MKALEYAEEALGYLKTIAETLPKLLPVLQVDIEGTIDPLDTIHPGSIIRTKATELQRIAAALEEIVENGPIAAQAVPCPGCLGRGFVHNWKDDGGADTYPCPSCRGSRRL